MSLVNRWTTVTLHMNLAVKLDLVFMIVVFNKDKTIQNQSDLQ